MELKEALLKRRSVRKFTEEAVSEENISELMHAAMSGPSASNRRPWLFYVITNAEKLTELMTATPYSRMKAPLAIVVCGNLHRAHEGKKGEYWIQDCSAAVENILLRVTDLDLGAVWCGVHLQEEAEANVKRILDLPEHADPLGLIYVGHPAEGAVPEAKDWYEAENVIYVR